MIVKREGGGWTLINQVDHAVHCGQLAGAWRDGPFRAEPLPQSLLVAATRHDLGWTDADQAPRIDEGTGHPRNFTQIDEAQHAAFYMGAVRTIAESDAFAAYLVSLHASGLYSRRYAWAGLKPVDWTSIGPHGRHLLEEERRFRVELSRRVDPELVEFESAWRSYMLLETFDYLSLLTCLGVESDSCGPVPTVPGRWDRLSVGRLGPWEVTLDPFPFPGDELVLEVPARHLGAERFDSDSDLRAAVAAAPVEQRHTAYRAPSSP